MEELTGAIQRSKELAGWIGDSMDGIRVVASDRNRLAGACFHIGLAHHTAITNLIDRQQYASAFALLRPQIDSFARGYWIARAATIEEIERVKAGNDPPGTLKLMRLLESIGAASPASLSSIAERTWAAVCDYTHTGSRMMILHMSEEEIGPAWRDEDLITGIHASDAWAIMIGIGIAGLSDNATLAQSMFDKGVSHFDLL